MVGLQLIRTGDAQRAMGEDVPFRHHDSVSPASASIEATSLSLEAGTCLAFSVIGFDCDAFGYSFDT